ncbi:endonuclease V [Hymenobacter volaticus]|uniref:Endonuclease V n=1 Tax=Hymenobacter volaticus TaxID=2932254 RepID=A0ABY4GBX0_9BACT|nr:endonuclease V [Hymenobacter volaticus]UOQ68074.1 endonuclease V [Hymenobacter volaticus]
MIVALDVYYRQEEAKAVGVTFEAWHSTVLTSKHEVTLSGLEPYEPGAFYKRELPCLLAVLEQINLAEVECLVIDGYVVLDDDGRPGLGWHLYQHLEEKVPVVGVAKTRFFHSGRQVIGVLRGQSMTPLYVTSAGINVEAAAAFIEKMAGPFRMPTLLQELDSLTRS